MCGSLIEVERIRNGNDVYFRDCNQLAIAAIHQVSQNREFRALVLQSGCALRAMIAEVHRSKQDALPDLKSGNVLADFDNFSRNIAAENVRQLDSGQARADPDIKVIHGASLDSD